MCCSGLKAIKQASYLNGKCSWPKTPSFVCSKCGNGTCDTGENPCNCEADCPKTKKCGPFLGGTCPTGQVCDIGSCMLGATGTCVPKPKVCESFAYQPTCGCDGTTYANPCSRLQAGVPLDHAGECSEEGKKCGPILGGTCPEGEVCNIPSCKKGATGYCVKPAEKCETLMYQPVCGCDGETYADECNRIQAGVPFAYKGECKVEEKKCGPFLGGTCPDGQVCDIQSCGLGASGTCKAEPEECIALYKPVCGCDGKTYGNDCERLRAGTQLAHDGKC
jgi:hypothetical protein